MSLSPTDTPVESSRRRPLRVSSLLLVVVMLVLGYALLREQRKEARLREALAAYKRRSQGQITAAIGGWHAVDLMWPEGTSKESSDVPLGEEGGSLYHRYRDVLE